MPTRQFLGACSGWLADFEFITANLARRHPGDISERA
jgi:hypothetical protein